MTLDADEIVDVAEVITALRTVAFTVEAIHGPEAEGWLDLVCYHEDRSGTALVVTVKRDSLGMLDFQASANPLNTRGGHPRPGRDGLREYLWGFSR